MSVSRRTLLAGAAGAAVAPMARAFPEIMIRSEIKPVVISSGNGNIFKNGGTETCVQKAYRLMMSGEDVLDSLIEYPGTGPARNVGGLRWHSERRGSRSA